MIVTREGDTVDKLNALIDAGARIDLQNATNGCNALGYAPMTTRCEKAAILMKAGADLSQVVSATSSSLLLLFKKGLDDLMTCYFGEDCRDQVKSTLNEVEARLNRLRRDGDPVVALGPDLKEKLIAWAQTAKRKIRTRNKRKKVVSFAPVSTVDDMGGDDLSSKSGDDSDDDSDSDGSSPSDAGSHAQDDPSGSDVPSNRTSTPPSMSTIPSGEDSSSEKEK